MKKIDLTHQFTPSADVLSIMPVLGSLKSDQSHFEQPLLWTRTAMVLRSKQRSTGAPDVRNIDLTFRRHKFR